MKYAAKNALYLLTVGLSLAFQSARPVFAQNVTGVSIIRQATNAADLNKTDLTTVLNNGTLLQDAVNAAWRSVKPAADKGVENAIGDNNSTLPKGITIYNQHSSLATGGNVTAFVDNAAHTINLKFTLLNNYIEFTSTVPKVAHLDPKLSVNYDMDITAVIAIPTVTAPLSVQSAVIAIRNSKLDSHNAPADVFLDVSAISNFFGGPNFKAGIENKINRQVNYAGAINQGLAQVNQQLQQLAQQGYTHLTSQLDQRTRRLMLQASPPSFTVVLNVQGDAFVFFQNDARSDLNQAISTATNVAFRNRFNRVNNQTYRCVTPADATALPIRILITRQISTQTVPGSVKPVAKPLGDTPHPGDGDIPRAGPKGTAAPVPSTIYLGARVLNLQYNLKTHQLTGSLLNGVSGDLHDGMTAGGSVNGKVNQSVVIPGSGANLPGVTLTITESR